MWESVFGTLGVVYLGHNNTRSHNTTVRPLFPDEAASDYWSGELSDDVDDDISIPSDECSIAALIDGDYSICSEYVSDYPAENDDNDESIDIVIENENSSIDDGNALESNGYNSSQQISEQLNWLEPEQLKYSCLHGNGDDDDNSYSSFNSITIMKDQKIEGSEENEEG
jgi:hypothetical protein